MEKDSLQEKLRFAGDPMSRFLMFSGLLAGMIGICFADSLRHVHRADSWWFFEDTIECTSFAETLLKTYSYPRTRQFAPGDIQLFRPLLFTFVSAELSLFGAHRTMPWQATALVLHFLATVLLLAVLVRLASPRANNDPGPRPWKAYVVPFALSALFAINCSTQEQVIWTAVTGYLLFAVFLLASMCFLLGALQAPSGRLGLWRGPLPGCWAATALAAFTYELGVFYAVLLGLVLPFCRVWHSMMARLAAAALFLLIPAGYLVWNEADWLQRQDYITDYLAREDLADQVTAVAGDAGLVNRQLLSGDTLANLGRYGMFSLVQPFFPNLQFRPGPRLRYQEHGPESLLSMLWASNLGRLGLAAGTAALGLWLSLMGLGAVRAWQGRARVCWPVIALASGCLAGHMALIVLGRMALRPGVLTPNAYYPYMTFLFFLLATTPFAAAGLANGAGLSTIGRRLLPTALGLLVLCQGITVRDANIKLALEFRYIHDLLASLNELVAGKGSDYRFAVDYKMSDILKSDKLLFTTDIPLPTLCFYRWIDQSNPVDVVAIQMGKLTVRPLAEVRAHLGTPPYFADYLGHDEFFVYFRIPIPDARAGADAQQGHWQGISEPAQWRGGCDCRG